VKKPPKIYHCIKSQVMWNMLPIQLTSVSSCGKSSETFAAQPCAFVLLSLRVPRPHFEEHKPMILALAYYPIRLMLSSQQTAPRCKSLLPFQWFVLHRGSILTTSMFAQPLYQTLSRPLNIEETAGSRVMSCIAYFIVFWRCTTLYNLLR